MYFILPLLVFFTNNARAGQSRRSEINGRYKFIPFVITHIHTGTAIQIVFGVCANASSYWVFMNVIQLLFYHRFCSQGYSKWIPLPNLILAVSCTNVKVCQQFRGIIS
jgi:hypothetical protein